MTGRLFHTKEDSIATHRIRLFMLIEAAAFLVAASFHSGMLLGGYEHREARIAESVIALALFVGLAVTWIRPTWTRRAGLAAQGFALFWTLVGILTIVIGIGPRTAPDIVYHIGIVGVLVWGLVVASRARLQHA
jgi:hypothetical protein